MEGEEKEEESAIFSPQYFCQVGDSGTCFGVQNVGLSNYKLKSNACKSVHVNAVT